MHCGAVLIHDILCCCRDSDVSFFDKEAIAIIRAIVMGCVGVEINKFD